MTVRLEGPAAGFLLRVVSCIFYFILKEVIYFPCGCWHLSINHVTFTLRQSDPREWGKCVQAVKSAGTGVRQQDAFGNRWPSLECAGQAGREGRGWPPGRSQIMKGLVLSAKKWELSLRIESC